MLSRLVLGVSWSDTKFTLVRILLPFDEDFFLEPEEFEPEDFFLEPEEFEPEGIFHKPVDFLLLVVLGGGIFHKPVGFAGVISFKYFLGMYFFSSFLDILYLFSTFIIGFIWFE